MRSAFRHWWGLPVDDLSRSLALDGMPKSLGRFIWLVSGRSQVCIVALAIVVFALNTAPLELQRLLVNGMVSGGSIHTLIVLALVYVGVLVTGGLMKLLMNVYRGWVAEKTVRTLRLSTSLLVTPPLPQKAAAGVQGVGLSMILMEPEPIGAFVGLSVSEVVLQSGILLSVFAYMFYVQPFLAVVSLAVFSPQLVFVPLMQRAINRRVQARITVLRETSVGVLAGSTFDAEKALQQEMRFAQVFELNIGIYKLKYSMNFLMNFIQSFGKVMILVVGGWHVIKGDTQVGTVIAFVSGLATVHDPWGDLVNWFQDMMVSSTKYQLFVAATEKLAVRTDRHGGVAANRAHTARPV